MPTKHLELSKSIEGSHFQIRINSLVGRLSLLADHPRYKLKDAMNFKEKNYSTKGQLSLVPMSTKNLFVLEDRDDKGDKAQNFIYVSDELSQMMNIVPAGAWYKEHIMDFFMRSISVPFFIIYVLYYYTVMRYYNTTDTLYVLSYITGVITVMFAVIYYYAWSSKTKSSFLRFCFKTELFFFIVVGTLNNAYQLRHLISSATDIF
ncbi:hypothetical protein [Pseudobdellovibrio exovorus]|uniref:Uncharacterized protein n=1 Tax=Pseudobdellovibrio exovorus JSS TaxID=1184267 RepID=M4VAN3_9BACT|nr:hypothetical protein [Pseudobdellovibrio exovorus]AGH95071.1 hypothetical protein A11Q_853 [Pseudobdellovibrio exovorus JSS]